jgi:pyridoxamine 5'-phosphate oxidase
MNTGEIDSILADIWARMVDGAGNRRSAFHTPVVASVDAHGTPQQRVMVMRGASAENRELRFHTDVRTPKVHQIGDHGAVSILGYDAAAKIQIRAWGTGRIDAGTEGADAA